MLWTFNQHNFAGGRLDKELMGRQDLSQYFKGTSELENFMVRRQGCVTKRRGTDYLCDLTALVSDPSSSRVVGIVNENSSGYYLVMTDSKGYLASGEGMLLNDGTWSRTPTATNAYAVALPFAQDEANEVDVFQSGDTLFMAHHNHPPLKVMVEHNPLKLKVENIDFGCSTWSRPRISSVEGTGFSDSSTAGSKTVQYICTYVKDGIESLPSVPYSFTYKTPWANTATVTIKCDKGNNADEPDYYNVYKKNTTEYGIISTEGGENIVLAYPNIDGSIIIPYKGNNSFSYDQYYNTNDNVLLKVELKTKKIEKGGKSGGWVYVGYSDSAGGGGLYDADNPARFSYDFGASSGTEITEAVVQVDGARGYDSSQWTSKTSGAKYYADFYQSGSWFKGTLTVRKKGSTDTNQVVRTAYAEMAEGFSTGKTEIRDSTSTRIVQVSKINRAVTFDFASGEDGLKTILEGEHFEVVSLKVESFSNEAMTTEAPLYVRGVKFYSIYGMTSAVIDDYITPDLSQTPPNIANHFAAIGDFPSCVGMAQQRLAYAATDNDPFKFWLSCTGDIFNFNTHSTLREDDAISATLAATEFPKINHIINNRDLMLLADAGEWLVAPVSGNTLSYKTMSAKLQSAIGCSKKLKPITVGDEIVFANITGSALLATRYNFASDGYETQDLSVMSQWLFKNNPVVSMAYKKNPDSAIECVLQDGTIAALVYMKEHEVCAWSRHRLGGGYAAYGVATCKAVSNGTTDLVFMVGKAGAAELWRVRDDIPVRGEQSIEDFVVMDGCRTIAYAAGTSAAVPQGMSGVRVSDGAVLASGAAITEDTIVGYPFAAKLETVYPDAKGDGESAQMEILNATEAKVRVIDSSSFYVGACSSSVSTRIPLEPACAEGKVSLPDCDARVVLAGVNAKDGRIRITHDGVWPLNILSIATTYQVEMANQNGGGNGNG